MRNAEQQLHVFNPKQMNAFIRNFKWHHSNSSEAPIPDEADLNLHCPAEQEEEAEERSGVGEEDRGFLDVNNKGNSSDQVRIVNALS